MAINLDSKYVREAIVMLKSQRTRHTPEQILNILHKAGAVNTAIEDAEELHDLLYYQFDLSDSTALEKAKKVRNIGRYTEPETQEEGSP
jgi:hypothetical protein